MEHLPGIVERMTMREMSSMVEIHPEDRIPRSEKCKKYSKIGWRS
jgi:hypothetical protein